MRACLCVCVCVCACVCVCVCVCQLTPDIARFWNTTYLDYAERLLGNVTTIASQSAPRAQVWLTETDSICHQGVDGVTNAYMNRLGL